MRRILALIGSVFHAGHGRYAAATLLFGFAALLAFPEIQPFKSIRLALFDKYQSVFPRERLSAPVTIVDIDEASLKRFGQWPWPRDRMADLITRVGAMGPAVIGLDIYMPEHDQTSPGALAARLPPTLKALGDTLARLPDPDRQLEAALRANPSVLGAAGFSIETLTTSQGMRTAPLKIHGGDPLPFARRYPFVLASLPEFQAAAHGQGLLSVDLEGGVVRRIPLVLAVGEVLAPSLAMEMLRVATGSAAIEAEVGRRGISEVAVADLRVRTQPNGEVWLHFGKADAARYVSAEQIFEGKASEDMFRNKLVLIGLSGFGLVDARMTPLGEQVPGMEIQAQLIETLFDGEMLLRPHWMLWIEIAMLLAGGGLLIWAAPVLQPRLATTLALFLYIVLFAAGFALFRYAGLLFDGTGIFAGMNIVLGSMLGSAFMESEQQRRAAQGSLHREREASAKVAGELAAARRIQLGTLPNAKILFADEKRFEVCAMLEPAREVGGDLYDFFMLDDRRLFFVVGDVSGKGVPASLFMAVTKALAKSAALRGASGVGAIVASTNLELGRENPEMLFVTMVAGILDANSGDLELCIAGHDAPWRIGTDSHVERIDGDGGPPLCMLEDFAYPSIRRRLSAGDTLCVVTDGVTEAMNSAADLYGTQRVETLLRGLLSGNGADAMVGALRRDVGAFVLDAEPSDDLTLLAIHWRGPTIIGAPSAPG